MMNNISFESTAMIRELNQDIAEFGADKLLIVWIRHYPQYNKEFIVNYDFINEESPVLPNEVKENERIVLMQARVLLEKLIEQNGTMHGDSYFGYSYYISLVHEARNYNDLEKWIAEYGFPADCPYSAEHLTIILSIIYDVARGNIKALIKRFANCPAFARYFDISYSTAQKWLYNQANPSTAMIQLIGFALISDVPTV